ncbi:MAG TPA: deoxynucleoside kinase [Polyangiaceae bacterium]|nr:deoxynucleoside kinase [Polyangiaceae bacterium]
MSARTPRVVAVTGNMGAGKSSLVAWLESQLGMVPFFEPNDDNPYLADFYGDMPRWALHSQLFFLIRRFRIHKDIDARALARDKDIVQDRTIYEDAEIFAAHLHKKGLIPERDWAMYQDLYATLRREIRPPDLMIYLRCPVATLVKRIKKRGRAFEQTIPRAYLSSLHDLYEEWFARYDASETIVVNTDRVDYLEHLFDRHELLETIRSRLGRG